jgi:hypothetical protein
VWDVYDQPAANKGEGQSMAIFGWRVTDGVQDDQGGPQYDFQIGQTCSGKPR